MYHLAEIKGVKQTDKGTDLMIRVADKKLRDKIAKLGKQGAVQAELRINDNRKITAEQRKKIFVTVADIADYTGNGKEETRAVLLENYCKEKGVDTFSLSNCSIARASDYLNYIIEFTFVWEIPLSDKGVSRTDDIEQYLYNCIKNRTCSLTGQANADIHHVSALGMGANRETADHGQYKLIALNRYWHNLVHEKGESILKEHAVHGIYVDGETLRAIGLNVSEIE